MVKDNFIEVLHEMEDVTKHFKKEGLINNLLIFREK